MSLPLYLNTASTPSFRRINLFGGPGSGKSTEAARLFSYLKMHTPAKLELVQEYVKKWAWRNQSPKGFDQVYLLGKQINAEETALSGGADFTVTDCPVLLSYIYAKHYNCPFADNLLPIIQCYESQYPSINVFIDRGSKEYQQKGRFQNLAEARELDRLILSTLQILNLPYQTIPYGLVVERLSLPAPYGVIPPKIL